MLSKKRFYVIQLGANDGVTGDPITQIVKKRKTHAVLIEAAPGVFKVLEKQYASYPHIRALNYAIVPQPTDQTVAFHYFDPSQSNANNDHVSLWGSLDPLHLHKFESEIGKHYVELIRTSEVNALTINQLYAFSEFPRLDLLQIDIEGTDVEIVKSIDFNRYTPGVIVFEHTHASVHALNELEALLKANRYLLFKRKYDMVCVHNTKKPFYLPSIMFKTVMPKKLESTP